MGSVIKIQDYTKNYGNFTAVQDLTLEIVQGEIFGFLGSNGAGKTTTIRALVNILLPTHGTCEIFGKQVTRSNPQLRDRIGYLPGEVNIPGGYRVKDFLSYIASLRNTPASRMDEICKRFEVPLEKKVKELSKGNKQKVGIILAFMNDPDLYILDEPTSGLDPLFQQEMYNLILEEQERGKTVFLSSHNLDEVQKICDRVAIIREGKLVSVENVADLSKNITRTLKARVENYDIDAIRGLGFTIGSSNEVSGEVELEIQGLDDVVGAIEKLQQFGLLDVSYPPASLERYFMSKYKEV